MAKEVIYNHYKKDRNVKDIAFIGGKRLQSAELNEMQSLAIERTKMIADAMFGSGHIVEGGQVFIDQDINKVIISPTRVYYDGFIHDIPKTELTMRGSGEEYVGFKVDTRTITFEDDKTLLDPAIGFSNYGMDGAQRHVYDAKWSINDDTATPIYRIIDGILVNATVPPEFEGIYPILARRTEDTNGSFLVSGMDGYIEPVDDEYVNLVVDAGKAYVLGFELLKPVPTKVKVKKAKDFIRVQNESKVFNGIEQTYLLNSRPVKDIVLLTATVEITVALTRGNSAGTMDLLPNTPVVSIVSVSNSNKTFVQSTDYQLTDNYVDWSLLGDEPVGGSTYNVTFRYVKTLIKNNDYTLSNNRITFKLPNIVKGSTFQTTYDFYLARKDSYYLTHEGLIKVIYGEPSTQPFAPDVPPNVLHLGELYLPPDSANIAVTNKKPKRLTMLELRSMLDRLERAEYNQAISDLEMQAQISDPALTKRGVFVDNFTTLDKADIYHADFSSMISPVDKCVMLPVSQDYTNPTINQATTDAMVHERTITATFTEEICLQQIYATEVMNVNPYSAFGTTGNISLNPSVDTWVEVSRVTNTVWRWWDAWFTSDRSETRLIIDENLPFIRQRTVTVSGSGFEPFADNIEATFDGVPVTVTPTGLTERGTKAGTVKADVSGNFTCSFVIPSGIRAGTREVKFFNLE